MGKENVLAIEHDRRAEQSDEERKDTKQTRAKSNPTGMSSVL
jgi:hypothetical protein